MVHFAASGNSGSSPVNYPARYASVIAVGAANRNGSRASFSTYGSGLEFLAPGEQIVTADRSGSSGYVGGDYATVEGTSFASPYAAGVAALLLSREPNLTPDQVLERMRQSCRDMHTTGYDTVTGWGLLNAHRTLVPGGAPQDDHGNTFSAATPVNSPSQTNGVIETGDDDDFFHFTLTQRANVRIASVSSMDPIGHLYGGDERLIVSNDDAMQQPNGRDFVIERELAAGTYYVRVESYGSGTGSYRLDINGTVASLPEMRIEGAGGQRIDNGSSNPSTTDGTRFSNVTERGESTAASFVVRNAGTGELQLTGIPIVALSGSGSSQFRVSAVPASRIASGAASTLRLEFAPTAEGTHTATITIRSNDSQSDPFSFAVAGTANFAAPEPPADDHGNGIYFATSVGRYTSTAGNLEATGDEDYFRFYVTGRTVRQRVRGRTRTRSVPQRVQISTSGSTDTYGYLMAGNRTIAINDDSGSGRNFKITANLRRGFYYVRVRGYNPRSTTGSYTLNVR